MRVALVHKQWVATGGTEAYLRGLAAGLAGRGHTVEIFCARWGAPPLPVGAIAHTVGWLRGSVALKAFSFDQAARWALRREVRRSGPYDWTMALSRVGGVDLWRAGGGAHSQWVTARGAGGWTLTDHLIDHLEARACRTARRVIAVSRACKGPLAARHGLPGDQLTVLPNPVDTGRFHPGVRAHRGATRAALGIPPEAAVLLLVGSGFERKGLATLIRGAARVRGASSPPVVVALGGDRSVGRYHRLAAELGIPLVLPGPHAEVEAFYGAADVFVLPSRFDPCANATLEAMACGLPVVTTRANGASEQLPRGMGVLDDACDVAALGGVLEMMMRPSVGEALGARGAARAQELSWDAHLDQLEYLAGGLRSGMDQNDYGAPPRAAA